MVRFPAFLADEVAALTIGKKPDDLIFAAPEGGVVRVSNWRRRVFAKAVKRLIMEDASFPVVTPHDLRHTAGVTSHQRRRQRQGGTDGAGARFGGADHGHLCRPVPR